MLLTSTEIPLDINTNILKSYCITYKLFVLQSPLPHLHFHYTHIYPEPWWHISISGQVWCFLSTLASRSLYEGSSYAPLKPTFHDFWEPFQIPPMINPVLDKYPQCMYSRVCVWLCDCSLAAEGTSLLFRKQKDFAHLWKILKDFFSPKDHQAKHLAMFLFTIL